MTRSFLDGYRSIFVTRVLVVAVVAVLGVNIGDTLSPANASVGSSNWTSYMNGNNSGFNSSVGFSSSHATITPANASMLRKVWTATSGGPVFAQPIVANETVYWGSFDGYERATSTSGKLVWKTFLGTTTPPGAPAFHRRPVSRAPRPTRPTYRSAHRVRSCSSEGATPRSTRSTRTAERCCGAVRSARARPT